MKMMLYDACFVIEFLFGAIAFDVVEYHHQRRKHSQDVDDDDPIVKVTWMRRQICNDLMLLENQPPLFVISEFFDMSYSMTMSMTQNPKQNHPSPTLTELAIHSVACTLSRESDIHRINFENMPLSKSKLDLVHNVFFPSSGDDESDARQNNNSKFVYNQRTSYKMPCVIELQDSGVKVGAEEDDDELNLSMLDIYFKHGHFKIPKFNVDDWAETFYRNIIAYEQHS
ncbi:UPF0481 protein [Camellia lanceoleosa]|nr:UPF0481 protein [Camellia lanceoleosa]